jgi:hypothetical protein
MKARTVASTVTQNTEPGLESIISQTFSLSDHDSDPSPVLGPCPADRDPVGGGPGPGRGIEPRTPSLMMMAAAAQ